MGFNLFQGHYQDNNGMPEWISDRLSIIKRVYPSDAMIIHMHLIEGAWKITKLRAIGSKAEKEIQKHLGNQQVEELCAYMMKNPGNGSDF